MSVWGNRVPKCMSSFVANFSLLPALVTFDEGRLLKQIYRRYTSAYIPSAIRKHLTQLTITPYLNVHP
jgi:hypothetical protein